MSGNVNCAGTMENSMDTLNKLKIELPYDAAISILNIFLRKVKTLTQNDNLHTSVYCSIIYNSQDKEVLAVEKWHQVLDWWHQTGPRYSGLGT